jgi:hypothetical protein
MCASQCHVGVDVGGAQLDPGELSRVGDDRKVGEVEDIHLACCRAADQVGVDGGSQACNQVSSAGGLFLAPSMVVSSAVRLVMLAAEQCPQHRLLLLVAYASRRPTWPHSG